MDAVFEACVIIALNQMENKMIPASNLDAGVILLTIILGSDV